MTRDHRYKLQDAYRCAPCGVQIRAPKGYMEAALRKCASAACDAPLPEETGGRPRQFCSSSCRQASYRLRRNSEGITEGVPA